MLRNILSIMLSLSIMAAGFPVVQNHGSVHGQGPDLKDSIQAVADFSRSADNPGAFHHGFRQAVTTLYAAAGLTQGLSTQNDDGVQNVRVANSLYLLAQAASPGSNQGTASFTEPFVSYNSTTPSPPVRPPRMA